MKALLFVGTLAGLLAGGASAQNPVDSVARVRIFLAALEDEPSTAVAMITSNAILAAGDVGGDLRIEDFASLYRQMTEFCSLSSLEPDNRPRPSQISNVIVGRYHCVTPERPEGHDVAVDFVFDRTLISVIYMRDGRDND